MKATYIERVERLDWIFGRHILMLLCFWFIRIVVYHPLGRWGDGSCVFCQKNGPNGLSERRRRRSRMGPPDKKRKQRKIGRQPTKIGRKLHKRKKKQQQQEKRV
jgi:hypothetical protein